VLLFLLTKPIEQHLVSKRYCKTGIKFYFR
jgi:hypothetical protein